MVGLLALCFGAVAASWALPEAAGQEPAPTIDVQIGDALTVSLADVSDIVVGALEVEIDGLPPLSGPCEPISGLGACSELEGTVMFVALNPTGWAEDTVLLDVELVRGIDPGLVEVRLGTIANVDGDRLDARLRTNAGGPAEAGDDGGPGLVLLLVVALPVLVAGAFGVMWTRRRDRDAVIH